MLKALAVAAALTPASYEPGFEPNFSHTQERLVMAVTKGAERRVYVFPHYFSATDAPCEKARREIRRTTKLAPGVRLYLECIPARTEEM